MVLVFVVRRDDVDAVEHIGIEFRHNYGFVAPIPYFFQMLTPVSLASISTETSLPPC